MQQETHKKPYEYGTYKWIVGVSEGRYSVMPWAELGKEG